MNHGAKAGGWQRAGRAALTLLILAGIVFVAYHDWVMAVAALLLIAGYAADRFWVIRTAAVPLAAALGLTYLIRAMERG